MKFSKVLMALALWSGKVWAYQSDQPCKEFDTQLRALLQRHSPGGPTKDRATIKTVEAELGPVTNISPSSAGSKASYIRGRCRGHGDFDVNGFLWAAGAYEAGPASVVSAKPVLDQRAALNEKIKDIQAQIDSLEALKIALTKQSAALPGGVVQGDRRVASTAKSQYLEDISTYSLVLETEPTNVTGLSKRANCYQIQVHYKRAIDNDDSVLQTHHKHAVTHQN